jgi:hypothetical protein
MKKKLFILVLSNFVMAAVYATSLLHSSNEIERVCATSNTTDNIQNYFYPVLTNIWFNASAFGEQELICFQENLYTGMMEYSKANSLTNSLQGIGNSNHRYMLGVVFGFPCVRDNIDKINCIADYIGSVKVLKDEEYLAQMYSGIAKDGNVSIHQVTNYIRQTQWNIITNAPNLKRAQVQYYPLYKKRGDIAKYRKGLLRDFKCKIVDYQRSVQDDDGFLVFCSNIVERADMSTEERVWVFGEMEGVR